MWDKFGYMASAEEINELAENLFNEGDTESIKALAEENGLDADFAQAYIEGEIPMLCDSMTAALGKIEMEVADLKPQNIMADWVEYLKSLVIDSQIIATGVRKEDKTLKGMIAALLKWSFSHQMQIDADIIKMAGISAGRVTLGIPDMATVKKLIREYYGG